MQTEIVIANIANSCSNLLAALEWISSIYIGLLRIELAEIALNEHANYFSLAGSELFKKPILT